MKPKTESLNRPFEGLGDLLRQRRKRIRLSPTPPPPSPALPPAGPRTPISEEEAFAEAMAGVQRIDWNHVSGTVPKPLPPAAGPEREEDGTDRLRLLVDCGRGFMVADTPEYMEGVGCLAPPQITRRLHRGDFSVQAHLDLHGLTVGGAREAFDAFMRQSVLDGLRAVLIIHGRGLSSPAEPVLKTRVAEWLTSGYWRKWVVAFTSARMCDGGSGASYVLLRRRPLSKRHRRRSRCRPQSG
jgi:DNA-nicking Smr family endonuclease